MIFACRTIGIHVAGVYHGLVNTLVASVGFPLRKPSNSSRWLPYSEDSVALHPARGAEIDRVMSPQPESGESQPASVTENPTTEENPPAPELTPEEQMALYEKELKENDWGHQPC
jgi:hypothetical protein